LLFEKDFAANAITAMAAKAGTPLAITVSKKKVIKEDLSIDPSMVIGWACKRVLCLNCDGDVNPTSRNDNDDDAGLPGNPTREEAAFGDRPGVTRATAVGNICPANAIRPRRQIRVAPILIILNTPNKYSFRSLNKMRLEGKL
jgi:hypothetical protein